MDSWPRTCGGAGQIDCRTEDSVVSGYAGHTVTDKELDFPDAHFLLKLFTAKPIANTIRDLLDGTPFPL